MSADVKVSAQAHVSLNALNSAIAQLNDVASQITSHGLALTDPNVWAGPAATNFANIIWPQVENQLSQVNGALNGLQSQVAGILSSVTAAGSSPLSSLPVVSQLPLSSL